MPTARSERLTQILTYDELIGGELPPIDWLVDGLIVRNDRCVLYGEWGAFKSWLALDIGLHLAAGKPWQGHAITRPHRTLFVDEEMNLLDNKRRAMRLVAGSGLPGVGHDVPFMFAPALGVRFTASGAQKLLHLVRDHRPEVIIIDSLRRVFVGDENSAADVSQFWRNLEPLRRAGISVILLHHMNKDPEGERDLRDRASGSTDIPAGADSSLASTVANRDESRVCVERIKVRTGGRARFHLQLVGDEPAPCRFQRYEPKKLAAKPDAAVGDFKYRGQASWKSVMDEPL